MRYICWLSYYTYDILLQQSELRHILNTRMFPFNPVKAQGDWTLLHTFHCFDLVAQTRMQAVYFSGILLAMCPHTWIMCECLAWGGCWSWAQIYASWQSQAAHATPTFSAASTALLKEGLCGMGMGVTLLQVNINSASLSPSPSHSLIYRLCNGERGRAHKALMNVPSFLEVSTL